MSLTIYKLLSLDNDLMYHPGKSYDNFPNDVMLKLPGRTSAQRVHVAGRLPRRHEGPRHGRRLRLQVHERRRHERRAGHEQDGEGGGGRGSQAQAEHQVDNARRYFVVGR